MELEFTTQNDDLLFFHCIGKTLAMKYVATFGNSRIHTLDKEHILAKNAIHFKLFFPFCGKMNGKKSRIFGKRFGFTTEQCGFELSSDSLACCVQWRFIHKSNANTKRQAERSSSIHYMCTHSVL